MFYLQALSCLSMSGEVDITKPTKKIGHRMANLSQKALLGCLAWLWCQCYQQGWARERRKFANRHAGGEKKQQQGPREKREGWE